MKPSVFEAHVKLIRETELAVFVSDTGDEDHGVWLPKSQIEIEDLGNGYHGVSMPEWLATDKGLV